MLGLIDGCGSDVGNRAACRAEIRDGVQRECD
jgi:hypothetical protein